MLYDFIIKNFILNTLFLISIIALIIFELNEIIQAKNSITPEKAVELINHENAILIDTRIEKEFKQYHIINSINIPSISKSEYILKKYKKKTIIIIHNKNKTAKKITSDLIKLNIKTVYIRNGINAWIKNKLPIKKK